MRDGDFDKYMEKSRHTEAGIIEKDRFSTVIRRNSLDQNPALVSLKRKPEDSCIAAALAHHVWHTST